MNAELQRLIDKHNAPIDKKPLAFIVEEDLGDDDCRKTEYVVMSEASGRQWLFSSRNFSDCDKWIETHGYRREA